MYKFTIVAHWSSTQAEPEYAPSTCLSNMPSYFDSHCHLQLSPLWDERHEVVKRAKSVGLVGIAIAATTPLGDDFNKVEQLYQDNVGFVFPSFGLHPYWISRYISHISSSAMADCNVHSLVRDTQHVEDIAISKLKSDINRMLDVYPAAGVGECGMDKRLVPTKKCPADERAVSIDLQRRIFAAQLDIAVQRNRYIVCHCVGSWGQLYELLRAKHSEVRNDESRLVWPRIILHSCNGLSVDMARLIVANLDNIYFSFSAGNVNLKVRDLIRCLPLDCVLLETDSPDQALQPAALTAISPFLAAGRGIDAVRSFSVSACIADMVSRSFCCGSLENGSYCLLDDIDFKRCCGDQSRQIEKPDNAALKELDMINECGAIGQLCEILSQFLCMSHEEFCAMTTANSQRVFQNIAMHH